MNKIHTTTNEITRKHCQNSAIFQRTSFAVHEGAFIETGCHKKLKFKSEVCILFRIDYQDGNLSSAVKFIERFDISLVDVSP